jgi:hypothetical protein
MAPQNNSERPFFKSTILLNLWVKAVTDVYQKENARKQVDL